VANDHKIVIISALDGTFQRSGFDQILSLIPKAEKVKKLSAICIECRESAAFSFRMITSKELNVIGGSEMYKPLCRECYNISTHKQEQEILSFSEATLAS
jgi:thymidine kinase